MLTWALKSRFTYVFKVIVALVVVSFIGTSAGFSRAVYAETLPYLPAPGSLLNASTAFSPVLLKGVVVDTENPFKLKFIIDEGQTRLTDNQLKDETSILIRYFLSALTIPTADMWVNLSPYEKDRVVNQEFGATDIGRDMLAQDYVLKQLSASLTYPESPLGKQYWANVYKRARELYGTSKVPVNTYHKIWITPDKTQILESGAKAYISQCTLKVMLEDDYLAKKTNNVANEKDISTSVVRNIILPQIEKDVNMGVNFAYLRQMQNAIILALWFKNKLKTSIYNQLYIDKKKIAGVDSKDPQAVDKIYSQYVEAFKSGVYNYAKKDFDAASRRMINRQYYSGGVDPIPAGGAAPVQAFANTPAGAADMSRAAEASRAAQDQAAQKGQAPAVGVEGVVAVDLNDKPDTDKTPGARVIGSAGKVVGIAVVGALAGLSYAAVTAHPAEAAPMANVGPETIAMLAAAKAAPDSGPGPDIEARGNAAGQVAVDAFNNTNNDLHNGKTVKVGGKPVSVPVPKVDPRNLDKARADAEAFDAKCQALALQAANEAIRKDYPGFHVSIGPDGHLALSNGAQDARNNNIDAANRANAQKYFGQVLTASLGAERKGPVTMDYKGSTGEGTVTITKADAPSLTSFVQKLLIAQHPDTLKDPKAKAAADKAVADAEAGISNLPEGIQDYCRNLMQHYKDVYGGAESSAGSGGSSGASKVITPSSGKSTAVTASDKSEFDDWRSNVQKSLDVAFPGQGVSLTPAQELAAFAAHKMPGSWRTLKVGDETKVVKLTPRTDGKERAQPKSFKDLVNGDVIQTVDVNGKPITATVSYNYKGQLVVTTCGMAEIKEKVVPLKKAEIPQKIIQVLFAKGHEGEEKGDNSEAKSGSMEVAWNLLDAKRALDRSRIGNDAYDSEVASLDSDLMNELKALPDAVRKLQIAGLAGSATDTQEGVMLAALKAADDAVGGITEEGLKLEIKSDGTAVPVFKNVPIDMKNFNGFGFQITSLGRNKSGADIIMAKAI